MGLPYIQLESDFIRTKAPRIGAILKIHRHIVIGMASELFDHAVSETSSKDKPPDGCIIDPDAGAIIEAWMGWTGEPGKAVEALFRADCIQKLEIGIRIKGMERYKSAWEKNQRRNRTVTGEKPDGNRTETGRKPEKTGPQTERKTETERKLLPSEVVSKAEPPKNIPIEYSEPQKPEAEWLGYDFFDWSQVQRQENGLTPEKRPHPSKLSGWWSAAFLAVKGDVARLKQAYFRFGADPYWEGKDPPHPFPAFMSQCLEKYVRQEAA